MTGVRVSAGFLGDGIAPHMEGYFPVSEDADHVLSVLRDSGAEMCISYLPAGSKEATRFYAQACLDAKIAFINGIPEFIASDPGWWDKFKRAGVPCAGDDIQSQVGATIVHRALVNLIRERGLTVDNTYQLDVGGNMDFDNLTDRTRVATKVTSKTKSLIEEAGIADVRVVPAEYMSFLGDKKVAYINVTGRQFGDIPFEIELKISVDDSPNNAGVIVDAVRAMTISLDRHLVGYQEWSAYFFKHPLHFVPINDTRSMAEAFIASKGL
jgi:myo-inositol-1-phosphate synthase